MAMRLGEFQVDSKKKAQLMYSIWQMLKESSTSYPMPYTISNEQELFINKWGYRCCFKYDLITKMQDGEEKDSEAKKFWWSIEEDCFTRTFSDQTQGYLENMVMDSYPDQVVIEKEESVVSERADPAAGVGTQVLPIPTKDCGSKCGESGGLVGGRQVIETT